MEQEIVHYRLMACLLGTFIQAGKAGSTRSKKTREAEVVAPSLSETSTWPVSWVCCPILSGSAHPKCLPALKFDFRKGILSISEHFKIVCCKQIHRDALKCHLLHLCLWWISLKCCSAALKKLFSGDASYLHHNVKLQRSPTIYCARRD